MSWLTSADAAVAPDCDRDDTERRSVSPVIAEACECRWRTRHDRRTRAKRPTGRPLTALLVRHRDAADQVRVAPVGEQFLTPGRLWPRGVLPGHPSSTSEPARRAEQVGTPPERPAARLIWRQSCPCALWAPAATPLTPSRPRPRLPLRRRLRPPRRSPRCRRPRCWTSTPDRAFGGGGARVHVASPADQVLVTTLHRRPSPRTVER